MTSHPSPEFRVYSGDKVRRVLDADRGAVVAAIEAAYRAHADGRTVNPDSYFLRFPERDSDRIIALPAHYVPEAGAAVTGIKWISSFPRNVEHGLARASAVLILNDAATGYPLACMEGGRISATRTAASAALGLRELSGGSSRARTLGIVGTGVISRYVLAFVEHAGAQPAEILLFDLDRRYAERFAETVAGSVPARITVCDRIEEVIRGSEVLVFATTASEPHVHDPSLLAHNPIVLHLSLRDLAPEVILAAHNVADDVDHALKARTSLHLTEMQVGNRDFVGPTLPEILRGAPPPSVKQPVVFSPFGMGVLDIALGELVHRALSPEIPPVPQFFNDA
jgi:ornithine cyclodeaminase